MEATSEGMETIERISSMSLHHSILKAYKRAKDMNWDKIYVLLDIHGTIAKSNYSSVRKIIYPNAMVALRIISKLPEVRLIIWSSCYKKDIDNWVRLLKKCKIKISAINETIVPNTKTGDFRKKPYFSVLIDDKAGFDPRTWEEVTTFFLMARDVYGMRRKYEERVKGRLQARPGKAHVGPVPVGRGRKDC